MRKVIICDTFLKSHHSVNHTKVQWYGTIAIHVPCILTAARNLIMKQDNDNNETEVHFFLPPLFSSLFKYPKMFIASFESPISRPKKLRYQHL